MEYKKPRVTLISHTPNPEENIALAARMCYSSREVARLREELTEEEISDLVELLLDKGHHSVLEMASFSFAIEGISRVTSHQLVRHRIGCSYAQKSQRYLQENDFSYIIPERVDKSEQALEVYREQMEQSQRAYNRLLKMGIHHEEARYLLPSAVETKIFITMNARALHHFFKLRCCLRSQQEIRELAIELRRQVRQVAPRLFKQAGAPCETSGHCPEGDYSCGRLEEDDS